MDGWLDGYDGWMLIQMNGGMDRWRNVKIDGGMDGWMKGRMG